MSAIKTGFGIAIGAVGIGLAIALMRRSSQRASTPRRSSPRTAELRAAPPTHGAVAPPGPVTALGYTSGPISPKDLMTPGRA